MNKKDFQLNRKKLNRKKLVEACILVIVPILIAYSLFDVYAKYYASKNNNGIAIASDLYFNSENLTKIDKLIEGIEVETPRLTTIDWVEKNVAGTMAVTTNSQRWADGDVFFDVKIQNYDNNILFNNADVNIEYKVKFKVLDYGGKGATYAVEDYVPIETVTSEGNVITGTKTETYYFNSNQSLGSAATDSNGVITLSGELKGGTLNTHMYRVKITLNIDELENEDIRNYVANRVLVIAYPSSPDYVNMDEDQPYLLVGLFEGQPSKMHMTIDSQGFLVEGEENFESKYPAIVKDLSGYIYNIKTAGDTIKDADNAIKQKMIVKWKSDYLDISQFDENYINYAGEGGENIETFSENGINYKSLEIEALPYTSINITFYKKNEFNNSINSDGELETSVEAFRGLVNAYIPNNT